jgi:hypothetical protein
MTLSAKMTNSMRWLQGDARWFLDSDNHDNDTFLIRRARFDVRGVLEDDWLYRIYATFIGERNGVLQEGWLEYRKYPSFRIRAGQVFEPFSLEAIYSALWMTSWSGRSSSIPCPPRKISGL